MRKCPATKNPRRNVAAGIRGSLGAENFPCGEVSRERSAALNVPNRQRDNRLIPPRVGLAHTYDLRLASHNPNGVANLDGVLSAHCLTP
jgi:hypothetical protein